MNSKSWKMLEFYFYQVHWRMAGAHNKPAATAVSEDLLAMDEPTDPMKMSPEIHCRCLGNLVANLQSLEFYLRAILSEVPGAKPCGLAVGQNIFEAKVGDELLDCPMTSYATLGNLIRDFNKIAADHKWNAIDLVWVEVRDALAHGRIAYAFDDKHDAFLMKFSPATDGKVKVTFNEQMDYAWFQTKITRLAQIHSDLSKYSAEIQALKEK